jgi:hypothetical protein
MLLALIKKLLSFGFVMKHLFSTKETGKIHEEEEKKFKIC